MTSAVEAEALVEVGWEGDAGGQRLVLCGRGGDDLVGAEVRVHEELELDRSGPEEGGDHGHALLVRADVPVVVEPAVADQRDLELEPDQRAERSVAPEDDVLHAALEPFRLRTAVGVADHLVGVLDEVGHEAELLQEFLAEEDRQCGGEDEAGGEENGHRNLPVSRGGDAMRGMNIAYFGQKVNGSER